MARLWPRHVGSPRVAKAVLRARKDDQLTESLEARSGSLDTPWGPKATEDFGAQEQSAQYYVLVGVGWDWNGKEGRWWPAVGCLEKWSREDMSAKATYDPA